MRCYLKFTRFYVNYLQAIIKRLLYSHRAFSTMFSPECNRHVTMQLLCFTLRYVWSVSHRHVNCNVNENKITIHIAVHNRQVISERLQELDVNPLVALESQSIADDWLPTNDPCAFAFSRVKNFASHSWLSSRSPLHTTHAHASVRVSGALCTRHTLHRHSPSSHLRRR